MALARHCWLEGESPVVIWSSPEPGQIQAKSHLLQALQIGFDSSHFFRRFLQRKHPVFTRSIFAVSDRLEPPPQLRMDAQCGRESALVLIEALLVGDGA